MDNKDIQKWIFCMYSKFIDLLCDRVELRKFVKLELRIIEIIKFGNREGVNYF